MIINDKQATALAALVEVAIAHGRRHYSESGEPLADARGARVPAGAWWPAAQSSTLQPTVVAVGDDVALHHHLNRPIYAGGATSAFCATLSARVAVSRIPSVASTRSSATLICSATS